MIYFSLFSMRLSPSHDSGHGLDKLTLIDPSCFFVCFFNCVFFILKIHFLTLSLLKIRLYNFFDLLSIGLSLFMTGS